MLIDSLALRTLKPHSKFLRLALLTIGLGTFLCVPLPAQPITSAWRGVGGGDWSDASQWADQAVPNGVGDVAIFTATRPSALAGSTINLDQSVTLGELRLSNRRPLTFSGGELLLENIDEASALIVLDGSTAPVTITSPLGSIPGRQVELNVGAGSLLRLENHSSVVEPSRLVKLGPGQLVFQGASPGWSGPLELHEGHVSILNSTVLNELVIHGGELLVSGGLYLSGDVELRGGIVQVEFESPHGLVGTGTLAKSGLTNASVTNLGSNSDMTIAVDQGMLWLGNTDAAGSTRGHTFVRAPTHAVLAVSQSIFDRIYLNNASGFANHGGMHVYGTVMSELALGDAGAVIAARDGRIAGQLSGGSVSFLGLGDDLSILSSGHSYTGATVLGVPGQGQGLLVRLADAGQLHSTSEIVLNRGTELRLDNGPSSSAVLSDRIGNSVPIRLRGGALELRGRDLPAAEESVGAVYVDQGHSRLTSSTGRVRLNLESLERSGQGTVFMDIDINVRPPQSADVRINAQPTLIRQMMPAWVRMSGDFASYHPTSGVVALRHVVTKLSEINDAGPNDHVQTISSPQTLTGNRNVASIVGASNLIVDLSDNELNIVTGGWMHYGELLVQNGRLTAGGTDGNAELFIYQSGDRASDVVEVAANITDNMSGSVGLTVGTGRVVLSGQNTFSGPTVVHPARVTFSTPAAVPPDNSLVVEGGLVQFGFDVPHPIDVGTVRLSQDGEIVGLGASPSNTRIDADEYLVESGSLTVSFSGSGTVRKSTIGRASLRGDNRSFSGAIEVHEGSLFAGSTSVDSAPYALGNGVTTVFAGGILVNASYRDPESYYIYGHFELRGGELTVAQTTSPDTWIYDGTVRVRERSRMAFYDADEGTPLDRGSFVLDAAVAIDQGVTLDLLGPANFRFQHDLQVDAATGIDVDEGRAELNGRLLAVAESSSLDVTGAGLFALRADVEVPSGRRLVVTRNGTTMFIDLATGRTLRGAGILANDLKIGSSARIEPGYGVGHLTVEGSITFGPTGAYDWQLIDPNATAVDGTGWDLLSSPSPLAIEATPSDPFVLRLEGLDVTGTPGAVAGFDPNREYRWPIAQASDIDGFDSRKFHIDANNFLRSNSIKPGAQFLLTEEANQLVLVYALLPQRGDFNEDGAIDVLDIDLLTAAVRSGDNIPSFDLDGDNQLTQEDRRIWVEEVKRTYFGDANLDGMFSTRDLIDVLAAGRYEDGVPLNATWATGDWNGDGDFQTSDFVLALQAGGFGMGPRAAAVAVPEPTCLSTLLLLLIAGRRFVPSHVQAARRVAARPRSSAATSCWRRRRSCCRAPAACMPSSRRWS